MDRAILLDFDGVIFHNTHVSQYVNNRSIGYIMNRSRVDKKQAIRLNHYGYKERGHTSRLYGDKPKEVRLYNYYVFEKQRDELKELISDTSKECDKKHLENILTLKKVYDHEYYLCTNTPKWYCEFVLSSMGIDIDELFEPAKFTSDHGYVKPSLEYFAGVEQKLEKTNIYLLTIHRPI